MFLHCCSCTVVAALAMVASLGIKIKVPKKATRDADRQVIQVESMLYCPNVLLQKLLVN